MKPVVFQKFWERGCACALFASMKPYWKTLWFENDAAKCNI